MKKKTWLDKIKETKEKRKLQDCKVYELKIQKLSKEKNNYLDRLFLESKWLYNNILSSDDIFGYDTKSNEVEVLNRDGVKEKREIIHLSSQMKQGVKQRLQYSVFGLSQKKKKGKSIGKLKFRSRINSIVLNQFGITYRIEDNKKYIKIQGFRKHFKVCGLEQIPDIVEYANAILVRKPSGYYLKVTCFLPKEEIKNKEKMIGIDFGIKDTAVFSNGEKINVKVPVNVEKYQRNMSRKVLRGKNRWRCKQILIKRYENINNRKKDLRNKTVSSLVKSYETIVIQNENVKAWQSGLFGKQIGQSCLGGIISDLKKKSHTLIMVDRFFPSTQLCPKCGQLKKLSLSERIYICDCGYTNDRDINSAINILINGVGTERIEFTPMEMETATGGWLSASHTSLK
jgi:putative transposase